MSIWVGYLIITLIFLVIVCFFEQVVIFLALLAITTLFISLGGGVGFLLGKLLAGELGARIGTIILGLLGLFLAVKIDIGICRGKYAAKEETHFPIRLSEEEFREKEEWERHDDLMWELEGLKEELRKLRKE